MVRKSDKVVKEHVDCPTDSEEDTANVEAEKHIKVYKGKNVKMVKKEIQPEPESEEDEQPSNPEPSRDEKAKPKKAPVKKERTQKQIDAWNRCLEARRKAKEDRDELKNLEYIERKTKVKENKAIKENRKLRAEQNAIKLKEKKKPKPVVESEEDSESESEEEQIVQKKRSKNKPKREKKPVKEESSESEYEYAYEEVSSQPVLNGRDNYYSMFRR
jgi:hypothetical protein